MQSFIHPRSQPAQVGVPSPARSSDHTRLLRAPFVPLQCYNCSLGTNITWGSRGFLVRRRVKAAGSVCRWAPPTSYQKARSWTRCTIGFLSGAMWPRCTYHPSPKNTSTALCAVKPPDSYDVLSFSLPGPGGLQDLFIVVGYEGS